MPNKKSIAQVIYDKFMQINAEDTKAKWSEVSDDVKVLWNDIAQAAIAAATFDDRLNGEEKISPWIPFSKEQPKTGDDILVLYKDGEIARFNKVWNLNYHKYVSSMYYWQPTNIPVVDQFEEWWMNQGYPMTEDQKETARRAWNAAKKLKP